MVILIIDGILYSVKRGIVDRFVILPDLSVTLAQTDLNLHFFFFLASRNTLSSYPLPIPKCPLLVQMGTQGSFSDHLSVTAVS